MKEQSYKERVEGIRDLLASVCDPPEGLEPRLKLIRYDDKPDENGNWVVLYDDGDWAMVVYDNLGLGVYGNQLAQLVMSLVNDAPWLLSQLEERDKEIEGLRADWLAINDICTHIRILADHGDDAQIMDDIEKVRQIALRLATKDAPTDGEEG